MKSLLLGVVLLGIEDAAREAVERAAGEIERLAPLVDDDGRSDRAALMDQLRGVLAGVASAASAPGRGSAGAWKLLESTASRKERRAAAAAAAALAAIGTDESLRRLIRCAPHMERAVRRYALELIIATGAGTDAALPEVISALERETDPESAAKLVGIALSTGTAASASALLDALPPDAREAARPLPSDPARLAVTEALVECLVSAGSQELERWLAGPAFEEASRGNAASRPRKLSLLARAAGKRRLVAARDALESVASRGDPRAALDALDALAELGAEPSRKAIEAAARRADASPALEARAAVVIGGFDRGAGVERLLEQAARVSWESRREAVLGLARFPEAAPGFSKVLDLLDDPNREVRLAAYGALRELRRKESIPAAILELDPLRGREPEAARSFLEWASGEKLGRDAGRWRAWWEASSESFRYPDPPARRTGAP